MFLSVYCCYYCCFNLASSSCPLFSFRFWLEIIVDLFNSSSTESPDVIMKIWVSLNQKRHILFLVTFDCRKLRPVASTDARVTQKPLRTFQPFSMFTFPSALLHINSRPKLFLFLRKAHSQSFVSFEDEISGIQ